MKTLLERLLLHPQRTLDLENQDGGDDFKILLCMRDPVLFRSMVQPRKWKPPRPGYLVPREDRRLAIQITEVNIYVNNCIIVAELNADVEQKLRSKLILLFM